MAAAIRYVQLIDYVPLYVALDVPRGGGLWQIAATTQRQETGSESRQVAVISGAATDILTFQGPTQVSLGDTQLKIECERLRRIRDEANSALQSIEAHLAMRKGR